MTETIVVPANALEYIAYQRTGYLRLQNNIVLRLASRIVPGSRGRGHRKVRLESMLRGRGIRQRFSADMWSEYEELRDWLPERVETVLDIGCGVAGIDVLLHRHYGAASSITYSLLDKSSMNDTVFYGFEHKGAFYNSLEVARSLLVQNGIAPSQVRLIEATADNRIDIDGTVDLVISLISWGFHYPVGVYLERVHEILKPGGRLILDIRRDTSGVEELQGRFEAIKLISSTSKKERYLAIR